MIQPICPEKMSQLINADNDRWVKKFFLILGAQEAFVFNVKTQEALVFNISYKRAFVFNIRNTRGICF